MLYTYKIHFHVSWLVILTEIVLQYSILYCLCVFTLICELMRGSVGSVVLTLHRKHFGCLLQMGKE